MCYVRYIYFTQSKRRLGKKDVIFNSQEYVSIIMTLRIRHICNYGAGPYRGVDAKHVRKKVSEHYLHLSFVTKG